MKNFTIRYAEPDDMPLLLEFIKGLAEYEKLSEMVTATESVLRDSLFTGNSGTKALFAYEGDIPVGFAIYFYNFSSFLGKKGIYLEDIFVLPQFRGKGYGRNILRHIIETAVNEKCGRVEWSVLDWNEPAKVFYRAMGAVCMSEWEIFRLTEDKFPFALGRKDQQQ